MTFAYKEMLFLLWGAPLLALLFWYGLRRRRKILTDFAAPPTLRRIAPLLQGRRIVQAVLMLLVMIALIGALSGVQYGYVWRHMERQGVSIILAMDCSKSMLATDIKPTRLERAKREVFDLLGMLRGDKIGIVAFAGTAFLQCPLTLDYSGLNLFLNALGPEYLPVGGTNLAAAVTSAMGGFNEQDGSEKAIILITDGESAGAGKEKAIEAAEQAAEKNIRIFCIGVGSLEGAPIPNPKGGFLKDASGALAHSKLDEETLERMASLTGGAYVRSVSGDMDLETIYSEQIRGAMATSKLESTRKKMFIDRYQWFVGFALAALLLEWLWPMGVSRRNGAAVLLAALALGTLAAPALAADAQSGLELYEQGAYDKALDRFLAAQVDNPEDPNILYNVGEAYYKLEKYQEAMSNYQAALQRLVTITPPAPEEGEKGRPTMEVPPQNKDLAAKTFYNMGNTAYRLENLPQAVQAYEQALQLNPQDEQAKLNLEFVRRKMDEQPQQEQQSQDNQNQDNQNQDEQKQDKQEQNKQDTDEQNQQNGQGEQPEQENPEQPTPTPTPDPEGEEQNAAPQQAQQDQQQEQQPEEQEAAQAGARPEEDDQEGEQAQAAPLDENVLNRLKDKPGAALMPRYEKRNVDKDW